MNDCITPEIVMSVLINHKEYNSEIQYAEAVVVCLACGIDGDKEKCVLQISSV